MILIDYVRAAGARLQSAGVAFGQGTTCALDEAAWLVLWRLGLPLDDLDGVAGLALTHADLQALDHLLDERIAARRPAAYLTGEAWLQGVPFWVDERTVVPRSLIAEVLADGMIDAWLPADPVHVLDLCTGNGSLAVLAAMAWSGARVDASDISPPALAVAARNVDRHGLGARIALYEGDGYAALPASRAYDVVLCNPPYVNAVAMAALPPEFRAEPPLALAGGSDGMDIIRPLLAGAGDRLAPDGVFVLEIGHERAHFETAFPDLEVVYLPTQLSEDGVVLITRDALRAAAPRAPRT